MDGRVGRFIGLVCCLAGCGGKDRARPDAAVDASAVDTPATTITVTLLRHPNDAAKFGFVVGYQDGAGPWSHPSGPIGDTYQFDVHTDEWGFIWTCEPNGIGGGGLVHEVRFRIADRMSWTDTISGCTDVMDPSFVMTVDVANISAYPIGVEFGPNLGTSQVAGTYELPTSAGTHDLVVYHSALDGSVDSLFVQRSLAVTGATSVNVDFNSALALQTFAVASRGTGFFDYFETLYSAGGTSLTLRQSPNPPTTSSIAATQMDVGDIYSEIAYFTHSSTSQVDIIVDSTTTPATRTFVEPAPFAAAAMPVANATSYPRIAASWSTYPDVIGYSVMTVQEVSNFDRRTWATILSPHLTSYQIPDLSTLPDWNGGLDLVQGTVADVSVSAFTSTLGAGDLPIGDWLFRLSPFAEVAPDGTHRVIARASNSVSL